MTGAVVSIVKVLQKVVVCTALNERTATNDDAGRKWQKPAIAYVNG
jgi:hypothetical protein